MLFALKTIVAALIISFGSGISKKLPGLAGFIIALPIASLIALAFSYAEHESPQASITFAKSIFAAVPISLFFFIPFLFADKLNLSFWQLYLSGLALLVLGFFLHKFVLTLLQ